VAAEYAADGSLVLVATTQVDGTTIRPDTWYQLAGGQWVEHEDD
jgi:hypothetical protein